MTAPHYDQPAPKPDTEVSPNTAVAANAAAIANTEAALNYVAVGQLVDADPVTTKSEPLGPGDVKQVIVIRRDLHMRRGKEIAQGSHASSAWISFAVADALRRGDTTLDLSIISEAAKVWLTSSFRKVTLQVQTEQEIVTLHDQAVAAGLESHLITDSGKTEFGGNPTITALAIGPDRAACIDAITGHLGIY